MRTLCLATLLVVVAVYSPAVAQTCVKYESELTLTGRLYSKVFPGPPNYQSIRKGDRKETAWLLTLTKPVCTLAGNSPGVTDPETNVTELQLVISNDAHWKTVRQLSGRRVMVTGTLFHSHTGHHHRNVLMNVATIRAGR